MYTESVHTDGVERERVRVRDPHNINCKFLECEKYLVFRLFHKHDRSAVHLHFCDICAETGRNNLCSNIWFSLVLYNQKCIFTLVDKIIWGNGIHNISIDWTLIIIHGYMKGGKYD